MIEKGQTLVNPVTGERMTFLETAAETGGDRVVIELRAEPGGSVAAAHAHPSQWETFTVVSGPEPTDTPVEGEAMSHPYAVPCFDAQATASEAVRCDEPLVRSIRTTTAPPRNPKIATASATGVTRTRCPQLFY